MCVDSQIRFNVSKNLENSKLEKIEKLENSKFKKLELDFYIIHGIDF